MKLTYHTYNLKFRHPFTISRGTKTHQPTLVVVLDHLGYTGYGEAPAITYYDITVEKMVADLERKRIFVEKFAFNDPERWWHYLHHLFPANPFLVCALDMAGWDLYGKMKGKPLNEIWQFKKAKRVLTDYTIGIDSIDKMVSKMQEKQWPIYKIKLGRPEDIDMVTTLRKHTDAVFRVDANAGWTVAEAREKISKLKDLGVELVEQPLEKGDWEGMKVLFRESALPLIADESCVLEQDVSTCKDHFHGINIKLTKCSGITPALRMIREARQLGLSVMIGSMNESTVGSAAIAHLAAQVDFMDADGPLLLEEDLASGLEYQDTGCVVTSEQPGLGIQFHGT